MFRLILNPTTLFLLLSGMSCAIALSDFSATEDERPNILLIITDDQSWAHVGCYGDPVVRTPAMDALAEDGVRFENAYCAAPSCSPSRAALLTGQDIYRLEEGGVLTGFLRDKFDVFPLLLEDSGYVIGNTGKPYWPRTRDVPGTHDAPIGQSYNEKTLSPPPGISKNDYAANFQFFLEQAPEEKPVDANIHSEPLLADSPNKKPFFFWVGMSEPHLPHPEGLGATSGVPMKEIAIPEFYPDAPDIRSGLSDYIAEIEWADQMVGRLIQILDDHGLAEDTIVVFTSDNGMPFPRAKATLYDYGVRMPLIIRWNERIENEHTITTPVSLIDIAPTILEMADLDIPAAMTGRSLKRLLLSSNPEQVSLERDFVVSAFEKHTLARPEALGYPRRALHSSRWTYIRNYEPDRFPAGRADTLLPGWGIYGDIDPSIIKTFFMENQDDPEVFPFFQLGFGKVPSEELYDKVSDPDMTTNLLDDPLHQARLSQLRTQLEEYLTATHDPRMSGDSPWDDYNLDRPFPVILGE
jgi:N-sulfoglucosamine sulfohydrolase